MVLLIFGLLLGLLSAFNSRVNFFPFFWDLVVIFILASFILGVLALFLAKVPFSLLLKAGGFPKRVCFEPSRGSFFPFWAPLVWVFFYTRILGSWGLYFRLGFLEVFCGFEKTLLDLRCAKGPPFKRGGVFDKFWVSLPLFLGGYIFSRLWIIPFFWGIFFGAKFGFFGGAKSFYVGFSLGLFMNPLWAC